MFASRGWGFGRRCACKVLNQATLPNHTAIKRSAFLVDGAEAQFVARGFPEHEDALLVLAGRHVRAGTRVSFAKLSASAANEVDDALLRVKALINVVMPCQVYLDAR